MKNLFLDDLRTIDMVYPNYNPKDWNIATDYFEFVKLIQKFGLPNFISFDHDLGLKSVDANGDEKTGYDCAKWLVDYCLDNNLNLPKWQVHSANPVGRANISAYLNNFDRFK
jgi:hypothetical protein